MLGKVKTAPKKAKVGPKSTTVAAYMGVFLLIMSMVAIGYQPPEETNRVASVASSSPVAAVSSAGQPSVDQIVATNVGASIATRANLPVAPSITNQSVSLSIQSQLAQTDSASIAKPQIVHPSSDSRTIENYVTKEGDSVTSIAAQFGITADTVKWANDLSGDSVSAGKELKILPVDGVLYTVKDGDTLQSIADKYKTSTQMVIVYNDLELSGVVKDKQLIVPSGVMPTEDRPGYVAPRAYSAPVYYTSYAGGYNGGSSVQIVNYADYVPAGVNLYSQTNAGYNGQCTWYAYQRRAAIGMPIPNTAHGNAVSWAASFSARGYAVNKTPSYGAIIQNGGGYGHVGVVESLNADGSITISEMNAAAGEYGVNLRTIPASAIGNFNYIH